MRIATVNRKTGETDISLPIAPSTLDNVAHERESPKGS